MRRRSVLLAAVLACSGALSATAAVAATCPGSAGKRCAYDRIVTIGGGPVGELHAPIGVAIGPDNRIYVSDSQPGGSLVRLNAYDRTGRFLRELVAPPGSYFQPHEIAISTAGTLYALDQGGSSVYRFDAAGNLAGVIALPYGRSGPTFSIRADHLAVAGDGSLWLLRRDGLVEHRDGAGTLLGSFQSAGGDLTGIAVAPDGNVIVGMLNAAAEYAPDGTPVRTLGNGTGRGIAFAANGDLLTGSGSSIVRFGRDGTNRREIPARFPGPFSGAEGIAIAPPGALSAGRPGEETIVLADSGHHRVEILAPDGTPLASIGAAAQSSLMRPLAAWGTPDGALLVADSANRRIARFDAAGAFVGRADADIVSYPEAGVLNPATGDSVIIDGFGANVRRIGPDGGRLGSWPLPGGGDGFGRSIAAAADGTIWVANSPGPHGGLLVAHRPDGTPIRSAGGGRLDSPRALATGPGGEVFVVEGGRVNSTVLDVFGPDGSFRRSMSRLDCLNLESVAVDNAGRIYAGLRDRIAVFDREGALLARFGEPGSAPGQFDDTRLSILGSVLTIAEPDNNRVTRVRIDPAAMGAPEQSPCGSVALITTSLRVTGTRTRVPLGCSGTFATACEGSVALVRNIKPKARITRRDILARAAFRITTARGDIALKLKARERRTLRRTRRLKARVVVTPRQGAAITRRVTLRLPSKTPSR